MIPVLGRVGGIHLFTVAIIVSNFLLLPFDFQLKKQSEDVGHSLSAFKEKLKENQKILSQLNAEIVAAEKKVKEAEKVAAKSKKELDEVSSMRDRQLTGACACFR